MAKKEMPRIGSTVWMRIGGRRVKPATLYLHDKRIVVLVFTNYKLNDMSYVDSFDGLVICCRILYIPAFWWAVKRVEMDD